MVDRNRVTGGGISSGLDEALKLIALLSNDIVAEKVQPSRPNCAGCARLPPLGAGALGELPVGSAG